MLADGANLDRGNLRGVLSEDACDGKVCAELVRTLAVCRLSAHWRLTAVDAAGVVLARHDDRW